jgi:hypothetical protein
MTDALVAPDRMLASHAAPPRATAAGLIFRHVLVPLDGSPLAERSLPYVLAVRSPWGRVSSRWKSGDGNWLCAHLVIPDVSRGRPRRRKLGSKRPCRCRASNPPGRSMKRTLQPRYTTHVGTDVRGTADAEPLRIRRRPVPVGKQQPRAATGSAGVRKAARRNRQAEESGEALATTPGRRRRAETRGTKKISRREGVRVSDEAIVSDDPVGQHNPRASQGPLDWRVHASNRSSAWPKGRLREGE